MVTISRDQQWIQKVLAGDREAFGHLYDAYAPLIRAICFGRTSNLSDAQDLAQDVFLRAYEKLDRLRDPARFREWLIGIARWRCREWHRQGAHRAHEPLPTEEPADRHGTSADAEALQCLHRVLAALPERERMTVHLFYLEGLSTEQARCRSGLSRSGFYRVLARARQRLKRLLTLESL